MKVDCIYASKLFVAAVQMHVTLEIGKRIPRGTCTSGWELCSTMVQKTLVSGHRHVWVAAKRRLEKTSRLLFCLFISKTENVREVTTWNYHWLIWN